MGAATFNIFNAGPQLKEANKALETFEANLLDYATGTCLKTDVITGNVARDFYFISGSVPDITSPTKSRWIDCSGVWQWNPYTKYGKPTEGGNVPAFFWTAGCCLFTFPDHHGNEQFAARVAYYMAKEPGPTGKHTSLPYLEKYLNCLYHHYFNSWVNVHNIFGGSACGRAYTYQDITAILVKQYSWSGHIKSVYNMVNDVMEKLSPKHPFISDFPYQP